MQTVSKFVLTRDRRRFKRYIVRGSAACKGRQGETHGALLNLGEGGLLVRAESPYQGKTDISVLFHVTNYPNAIASEGRIVEISGDLLAIEFLAKPNGLDMLLHWLEEAHYAWSGVA